MAKIQIKSDKRTLLEEYFLNKEQFDNVVKERNVSSMVTTLHGKRTFLMMQKLKFFHRAPNGI